MFDTINRWLIRICQVVSGISFCFMALVAFADSFSRKTSHPLLGGSEYVEFALIIFFFSSLGMMVKDDEQIRVGLFSDLYKPKLKKMERIFTGFCEIIALCVLCYLMFDQASRLDRFGTVSTYLGVPWAPFVYIAAAISVIAIWMAVVNFFKPYIDTGPHPHAIPDEDI